MKKTIEFLNNRKTSVDFDTELRDPINLGYGKGMGTGAGNTILKSGNSFFHNDLDSNFDASSYGAGRNSTGCGSFNSTGCGFSYSQNK